MGWRLARASVLVLVLAAAGPAWADVVEVTGWQANVRQRPSRNGAVIVNVRRGEQFEMLGRVGSWYHVRIGATGETGFVHSSLVRVIPGATAPQPPQTAPAPAPAAPPPSAAPATAAPPPEAPAPVRRTPAPAPRPAAPPAAAPPPIDPPAIEEEAEPSRFEIGAEGGFRWLSSAPDSAKALFGGETGDVEFGGFLTFAVSRHIFVSASGHFFEKEGERVFVIDPEGPVFPLGHPLKLRLIPAHLVIGYRFYPKPWLVPYLAVGGGATFYREESTIGGVTESESRTKGSGVAAAGVDFVKRGLLVGVKASWTSVPDAVGASGVSAVYGEDDVGGLSVSVRLGVSF
jgi:hypothetical protein